MELTNCVGTAKLLLLGTARTTVLAIVPLVVTVPNMQAGPVGVVLPLGSPSCTALSDTENNVSCLSNIGVGALSGGALTGVQFFSTGGGVIVSNLLSTTDQVTLSAGGMLTGGPLSGPVPVSFSFSVSQGAEPFGAWSVLMELGSSAGASNFGSVTFNGTVGNGNTFSASQSGSLAINASIPSGATLFETALVTIPVVPNTDMILSFPFDFGTSVPEPASLGSVGAGLGIVAWLFRRRRSKA